MATDHRNTIVRVFDNQEQARQAIAELKRAGFTDSEIGVVARDKETRESVGEGTDTHVGAGAAAGAAAGLGLGALWGAGILAGVVPGIGPAIAGGTLGVLLSSAATGAAAAGVAGALIGLGIPDEEARYYEEEFKQGRILVTVKAPARRDEARDILHRSGGYDLYTGGPVGAGARTPTVR